MWCKEILLQGKSWISLFIGHLNLINVVYTIDDVLKFKKLEKTWKWVWIMCSSFPRFFIFFAHYSLLSMFYHPIFLYSLFCFLTIFFLFFNFFTQLLFYIVNSIWTLMEGNMHLQKKNSILLIYCTLYQIHTLLKSII